MFTLHILPYLHTAQDYTQYTVHVLQLPVLEYVALYGMPIQVMQSNVGQY